MRRWPRSRTRTTLGKQRSWNNEGAPRPVPSRRLRVRERRRRHWRTECIVRQRTMSPNFGVNRLSSRRPSVRSVAITRGWPSRRWRQLRLEAAGMIAARLAPAVIQRAPLQLVRREPYVRVGDNWATRAGRRAHAALKERVAQKPGWRSEPEAPMRDGRVVRPDVQTPPRVRAAGREPEPFQMELKPNTPSGRRAAEKAVKKYEGTGVKTRPIFSDPKPFI
jgi:hypothetical protein